MENEEIMMNETSTEDMVPVEDNALANTESGYEAVSYTHLDVYKRQVTDDSYIQNLI